MLLICILQSQMGLFDYIIGHFGGLSVEAE